MFNHDNVPGGELWVNDMGELVVREVPRLDGEEHADGFCD